MDRDDLPFAALLPHGMILDDGVVLLSTPQPRRAGLALGIAWDIKPRNVEVSADAVCLHMARVLEGLLLGLPEGSALQVILRMRPAQDAPGWSALRHGNTAPAVVFQRTAITQGLCHYEGTTLAGRLRSVTVHATLRLPVQSVPPTVAQRLRAAATLTDTVSDRLRAALQACLAQSLEQLAGVQAAIEDAFSTAGIAWQRQPGAAIGGALASALSPLSTVPPVIDHTQPLRQHALATPAMPESGGWHIGSFHARVLSLRAAPLHTFPGMLSATRAPHETLPLALWDVWPAWPIAIVVNVAVPNREAELGWVRLKRNFAVIQRKSLAGDDDPEKQALKHELDTVLTQAYTAGHQLLWARVHVTVWGPRAMMPRAEEAIVRAGRRLGLEFIPEPILGSTLFLQTLPLGFDPAYPEERFVRRARRLPSNNIAQLLPLYGAFGGTSTPAALYLNRQGEAVGVDHFDLPTAPHAVVVGTSGSGKSFLINHLVHQVLPLGAAVVILDRWASYEELCMVCDGNYVQVDFDQPVCFNPFVGPLDRSHRAFLVTLLAAMASGDDEPISREERAVLSDALVAFARQQPEGAEPQLGHFIAVLQQADAETEGLGRRVARKLSPFHGQGPYAGFFDGDNAFALDRQVTIVELSRLRDAPDLQTALMLVLLHQLTVFFADPVRLSQRKYLISDETWALLHHPASARVLEEVARTFRKLTTSAMFVSQQGSDFAGPAGKAIRDNAGAFYLLQQNPEEVETMRTLFDLSEQEVALVKTVHKRARWNEAYLRLPDHTGGIIRIVPDPYVRWCATQHPAERAAREAAVRNAKGDLHQAICTLATQYPEGLDPTTQGVR
jgi:hypothetical protein